MATFVVGGAWGGCCECWGELRWELSCLELVVEVAERDVTNSAYGLLCDDTRLVLADDLEVLGVVLGADVDGGEGGLDW